MAVSTATSEGVSDEAQVLETLATLSVLAVALLSGPAASAHPHVVEPSGQVIANGQNHAPFVNGVSCGGGPAGHDVAKGNPIADLGFAVGALLTGVLADAWGCARRSGFSRPHRSIGPAGRHADVRDT
jgi:hypothetical protein